MSKSTTEIASEIIQAVIQARSVAIAPATQSRGEYINLYLSDDAISKTYKKILQAVENPNDYQ